MTFDDALALHDVRALSDADEPVDDTGFVYSRLIPGDRVDTHECDVWERSEFDLCWRSVCCDAPF